MVENVKRGPWIGWRWLAVAAYVGLIFFLSDQPGLRVPGTWEYRDKVAHLLEYGGLGFLVWLAVRDSWPATHPVRRALLTLLAIAALAASDEVFQKGVPGRESSAWDWLADVSGALLAQLWGLSRTMRRKVG